MELISVEQIERWDSIYRRTLMNAVSGPRSLFLMGTSHANGTPNLGLFFNLLHVGAHPPLLGVLFRPLTVPRHSYSNLMESSECTLNLVTESMVPQAHQASANFAEEISEFEAVGLGAEYHHGFRSPAVAESPLQMGLRPIEEHQIKSNGTILVVLKLEWMRLASGFVSPEGFLRLEKMQAAVSNGLDGYAGLARSQRFAYAKVGEPLRKKEM
jgi:flavin reductase (DIM6/NTAB) family NADH-FMN oxidoreductase RutF